MKEMRRLTQFSLSVAILLALLTIGMVGVFAILGHFERNVLWGGLTGYLVMILNYFFLAVTVSRAADRAEQGEVEAAKRMMKLSSVVRLAAMGVVLVIATKLGANILALLLPLAFARPILLLSAFLERREPHERN